MQQILNHPRMDPLLKSSLYFWKSGNFYRISFGLITQSHEARLQQYRKVAYELGFSDCYLQQCHRINYKKDPATRQPKRPG